MSKENARNRPESAQLRRGLGHFCVSGTNRQSEAVEGGDAYALQVEKQHLEDELSMIVSMTQNIVAENARIAQDQDEYQKRYDSLVAKYDETKTQYDSVTESIAAKEAKSARLADFISLMKSQKGVISEFDIWLWSSTVEFVTVGRNKEITVTFRDGTKILA